MVMVSLSTALEIINSRNFKTQSRLLANSLNYKHDKDAEQDLLHHFLTVRCKNMTQDEFNKYWNDDSRYEKGKKNHKYMQWLITYSRHDLIRLHQKEKDKEHDAFEVFKMNYCPMTNPDDENEDDDKTDRLKELALANCEQLFYRARVKRKFTKEMLSKGEDSAKDTLAKHSSINGQIQSIKSYCDKQRANIDKLVNNEFNGELLNEYKVVRTFNAIENNDEWTIFVKDGKEYELIDDNKDMFEELIGKCKIHNQHIKHPISLLNDWCNADNADKELLCEYLELRESKLRELLNES